MSIQNNPKKKLPKGCLIIMIVAACFFVPLIILIIIGIIRGDYKTSDSNVTSSYKPINMDSLVSAIKKDSTFHIKDVYYNKKDSSMNIAFTDKEYSTLYFDKKYHTDSIREINSLHLFKYITGRTLAKNEYNTSEELMSYDKKMQAKVEHFNENYFGDYQKINGMASVNFSIKEQLKDPDSYEVVRAYEKGYNEDGTITIVTEFRSKNSFGGYVMGTATCDVNMDNRDDVTNLEISNE